MAIKEAPRYALAVFQEWPPLLLAAASLTVLPDFGSQIGVLGRLALFAAPDLLATIGGVDERFRHGIERRTELLFAKPPEAVGCSGGGLAQKLSRRVEEGCASLAEALAAWMMGKHAAGLADDVSQGRLLLWARLFSPELERQGCMMLLRSRPLRLEVHDLVPVST